MGDYQKTHTSVLIKKQNRILVFKNILEAGDITKPELAASTGLSLPTVIQATKELCEMGLVQEMGVIASSGGRRPQAYRPVCDAKIALSIDITRNHIRFSAVDLAFQVLVTESVAFRAYEMSSELEDSVLEMYEAFLTAQGLEHSKIIGVGISLPGIIERDKCVLRYSHIFRLTEPYSLRRFESLFDVPVYFQNDANCACLSECYFADTPDSFLYVSLSNSIGGALYLNGSLLEGNNQKALEIGHMSIIPNGKECYCGHKGHYDPYGSAQILSNAAGGSLPLFFSELGRGNAAYKALMDEYIDHLVLLIYNLRICFDVPIVLGGYVGGYLGPYLDAIRQKIRECSLFDEPVDYLTISHYHFEAATVGIAKFLVDQFIKAI